MKILAATVTLAAFSASASAAVWINEFHYDNSGGDLNEFVEVVVSPDELTPLSDITLTLYNGNGGSSYGSHALDTFTEGDTVDGFTIYYKEISGIQNGAPDGMSLDLSGSLVEFISYEGTFDGAGGVADGVTSSDIGVSEGSGTTEFSSLGLTGGPGSFSWTNFDDTATKGSINVGQTFVPAPGAIALLGLAGFAGRRRRRG